MDTEFFKVGTDGCGSLVATDTNGEWQVSVVLLDTKTEEPCKADFVNLMRLVWNAMENLH